MPAAARAQVVAEAIGTAKSAQLVAAGIYRNSGVVQVLANSAGLFGYFPWSRAAFSITTRTSDGTGSGYSAISSNNGQSIDCKEAAAIAVKKALDSRGARELPPGAYPAILEPQAVADISSSLVFALNVRLADEGRSVFSAPGGKTRVGEKMFDPRVHIQTDPQHPVVPRSSFSAGGSPTRQ